MDGPDEVMEMPALGRPFRLGMLYDCYKDALLLEHSFVDSKTCEAHTEHSKYTDNVSEQIPYDAIGKRAAALEVKPSLLTSLLCGLFEVDGCAKYLLSAKAFGHPGSLIYRSVAIERFAKLELNDLGPEQLNSSPKTGKWVATHVVTGVWYGDQAICDCDPEAPASENMHENMRRTDVKNAAYPEQGTAPSKTVKSLIKIVEKDVPIKVRLYPLRNLELEKQGEIFFHEIRHNLNSEIVSEMEGLLEAEARCNVLLNSPAATTFPGIRKKIHRFRDLCEQYKQDFQQQLAKMVPSVREGKKEEKDLEEILKKKRQSPFNPQRLSQFLDEKEQEVTYVNDILSSLKKVEVICFEQERSKNILCASSDFVVAFMFTSLQEEEPYLSELEAFLSSWEQPEKSQRETQSSTKWYEDQAVIKRAREMAKSFSAFAHANRTSKKTQFLVASVQDESNPGASVYLYESGVLEKTNFEPPSKPLPPEIEEFSHDTVWMRVTPVACGKDAISHYQVEWRTVGQEDWALRATSGKEGTVPVMDLCPDTEYEFRYAAVSKPGISESSDVCRAVRTLPKTPEETQGGSPLLAVENQDSRREERNSDSTRGSMPVEDEGNKNTSDQSTRAGMENAGGLLTSPSYSFPNDANLESESENTVAVKHLYPDTKYKACYATMTRTGLGKSSHIDRAVRTPPPIPPRRTKETQGGSPLLAVENQDTRREERNSDITRGSMPVEDEGNKNASDQSTRAGMENPVGPLTSPSYSFPNDANLEAESENTVSVKHLYPDTKYRAYYATMTRTGLGKSSHIDRAIRTLPPIHARRAKETHGRLPPSFLESQDIKAEEENTDCIKATFAKKTTEGPHSSKESARGEIETVEGLLTSASNPLSDDGTMCVLDTKGESESLASSLHGINRIIRKGWPCVYALPFEKSAYNSNASCVKYRFGRQDNLQLKQKVVMFLGETGAGKSTLINRMVNHILGVRWEDNFRYSLVQDGAKESQAHSQTDRLTVYEINWSQELKIPFSLTLIDTPGFGDTRGINHDKMLMEEICEFFSTQDSIDHMDAICLVVQASQARLTQSQKYIFNVMLSIFGKDIRDNILFLVTFADGGMPPVLETIEASDMPCARDAKGVPIHFTFNNSALFASNVKEDEVRYRLTQMIWERGERSLDMFFQSLNDLGPQSLTLTRAVLNEWKELEAALQSMKPQVQMVLVKLGKIRKKQRALEKYSSGMKAKKNFEYEVGKVRVVRKEISDQRYRAVNCQRCFYTCYYFYQDPSNSGKWKHSIMDKASQQCLVCPRKCPGQMHCLEGYLWEQTIKKEKPSFAQLKEKYLGDARGSAMTEKKEFERLKREYAQAFEDLVKCIETSAHHLQRLQKTALRPNQITAPEYIDLLVNSEEKELQPGYAERIEILKFVKERFSVRGQPLNYKEKVTSFTSPSCPHQ
ncbi:hypothetical protein JD844_003856 [Phrynosoma platyrhinos]|uniref:Fibronectin type-III domain-containing protein n=1 Tax=Phrynosoma platyrhinos TaxID=52577 RepID=A0ABQ7TD96_PHRPL|nr:hypothetical protein JD844_003856 [Phrynosoma platyrhinos]